MAELTSTRSNFLRQSAVIGAAILLAFLALDDITTDNATSFTIERLALVGCGVVLLRVTGQLLRDGHRLVAGICGVAILAGAISQPALRGANPWSLAYVATASAVAWFVALSIALLVLGRPSGVRRKA